MDISIDYLKEQQKVISQSLDGAQRQAVNLEQNLVRTQNTIQQLIGQLNLVNKQIEDANIEDKTNVSDGHKAAKGPGKKLGRQGTSKEGGDQEAVAAAPGASGLKSAS